MSTDQLTAEAMATNVPLQIQLLQSVIINCDVVLPLAERVSLAQALWESIDAELPDVDEHAAIAESIRRDEELSSGAVTGRSHEEVMDAARRALE